MTFHPWIECPCKFSFFVPSGHIWCHGCVCNIFFQCWVQIKGPPGSYIASSLGCILVAHPNCTSLQPSVLCRQSFFFAPLSSRVSHTTFMLHAGACRQDLPTFSQTMMHNRAWHWPLRVSQGCSLGSASLAQNFARVDLLIESRVAKPPLWWACLLTDPPYD